jgi:UDP-GlcNAc3NAcA epimerase
MKVVTVVGARPQFIKAMPVSRAMRESGVTEILVHTGQHYDPSMSDVFFDELGLPKPDANLGVGSGTHGAQTGQMLAGIETILLREQPDWTLVYGDTNSTLAGALAASKLHIRVAHVEAGLRSFNRRMPEEINRVLTDHIADLLFCPSQTAVENLRAEGITRGVAVVGDVMAEALHIAVERSKTGSNILQRLGLEPKGFLLATVHRAENTDDPARLRNILQTLAEAGERVVFPVHPRTRKFITALDGLDLSGGALLPIDPVGYLDMAALESGARMIFTDSGGVQKEAYWLGTPCVTLRDETEWVETVEQGWNVLVGADREKIRQAVQEFRPQGTRRSLYGEDGAGSHAIVHALENSA